MTQSHYTGCNDVKLPAFDSGLFILGNPHITSPSINVILFSYQQLERRNSPKS